MKKIDKKSELARLLCKLLRSCDRDNLLVSDLVERNWYIHFGRSAYGGLSTAYCEVEGTPPKGQLLIDMYGSADTPVISGGSMFKQFFRKKKITHKLEADYYRAKEILNELCKTI